MREIKITNGYVAYVDDEDYDYVNSFKWHISTGYARTRNGYGHIKMHNLLMKPQKGLVVDHKDGNKLNNQRSNLRICTQSSNTQNRPSDRNSTSKYKGVSSAIILNKYKGKSYPPVFKWRSHIMAKGKKYYLGSFDNEIDAAKAYNEAALKHHGEYAKINIV